MSTLKVVNLQHPDAASPSIVLSTDGSVATSTQINEQTGTSYTLALSDNGKLITLNNAAAITLTIPPNSSVAFPVGSSVALFQYGAGQVTVTRGSGVTLDSTAGANTNVPIGERYAGVQLYKVGTDAWIAIGNIA